LVANVRLRYWRHRLEVALRKRDERTVDLLEAQLRLSARELQLCSLQEGNGDQSG
jgi:hypothetical protein